MALCPECGSEVDNSQEYCRNCGANVEGVESPQRARIHLREKDEPVVCEQISYPSMGGDWVRAEMEDGSKRIYPTDRVEYIETSPGNQAGEISALPGNAQVKEVDNFDSLGQFLNKLSDTLS